MFSTKKENKAFRIGLIVGMKRKKKTKHIGLVSKKTNKKNTNTKAKKPTYLGPTYVNGKFYDTNFKKPQELEPSFVRKLHSEYDLDGKSSDKVVVDRYVLHMRRKYGSFDKNGRFLGLLGDK